MSAANIDFESDTDCQEIWRSAMTDRTTEALQAEYPETGFTATVALDRRALGHKNNIPQPRLDMISGIPTLVRRDRRPMRAETQARGEATPDHERKTANMTVDRMAGRCALWTATPLRPPSGHFGRWATEEYRLVVARF